MRPPRQQTEIASPKGDQRDVGAKKGKAKGEKAGQGCLWYVTLRSLAGHFVSWILCFAVPLQVSSSCASRASDFLVSLCIRALYRLMHASAWALAGLCLPVGVADAALCIIPRPHVSRFSLHHQTHVRTSGAQFVAAFGFFLSMRGPLSQPERAVRSDRLTCPALVWPGQALVRIWRSTEWYPPCENGGKGEGKGKGLDRVGLAPSLVPTIPHA
ncbi:uncharacterized protein SPSK_07986 [Sporothrix schenckii 1099-18]|uniref:Uncharacterized protein n=1 Tax=Sporothrix schenckii 1099-18 TaxID=1397361 RepID=A0A0F2MHM8_SPOSC|nr:uncharacterized protein SPSK_07986 [Sporothrix schenckii 1099-18]KJR88554.1 hypothetical protein SPSK_07986 [Sporothrix schenckii 1099-18]